MNRSQNLLYTTIVAGSRNISSYLSVKEILDWHIPWKISKVVSGTAQGVDVLGERWATEKGIKISRFPADWAGQGKKAGYLRNLEMSNNAQALVAIWDGESKGTKHMIDIAIRKGLTIAIFCSDKEKLGVFRARIEPVFDMGGKLRYYRGLL